MILLVKHTVTSELIRQKKQTQINKDNIRKNRKQVNHLNNVGDKVMLVNLTAYKYETIYKGPFVIMRCFTNGAVSLQCGATQLAYNIFFNKHMYVESTHTK